MPINDDLLDAATRHQVFLLRYGGATANQVTAILDEATTDLAKRIKGKLARLQPGVKRLQAILTDVRAQRRDVRRAMVVATRGDLVKLADIEVNIAERRLTEAIGVDLGNFRPSPEVLRSIVTDEAMRGKRIGEWFTQLSDQHRSRLEGAVRLGLIEGRTTPQIIRDLRAATEITKRSATTLVRTSVNHVANRARESLYEANKDVVKGMRWSATLDGKTSEICISRDGAVTPVGDAKQSELDGVPLAPPGARPPAHLSCLPGDSLVTPSGRITAVSKRWFDGDLIVIRTAAGRKLRTTPNHPILTGRGWVGAERVQVGEQLFTDRGIEGPSPLIDYQDQDAPAPIHEVAEAFLRSSEVTSAEVPTTTPDFHGDGINGEVAIIGADRGLLSKSNSLRDEKIGNLIFQVGDPRLIMLTALCPALQLNLRNGSAARRDIGILSQSTALSFSRLGVPLFIPENDFLPFLWVLPAQLRGGPYISKSVSTPQPVIDGTYADAELFCDAMNRATGEVALDDVINVERVKFSGHVYNLQTERQLYIANGLVVHNCRSIMSPITRSWQELSGKDLKPGRGAARIDDIFDKRLKAQGLKPGQISRIKRNTRASMNGQVPVKQTYPEWLKRQDAKFQNKVLGTTKGKLFREGGLTVDKFVDAQSGQPFTLRQLREVNEQAFMRAGVPLAEEG